MKCYIHSDAEAVGTCVACGKPICLQCLTEIEGKNYCKTCVNDVVGQQKRKIEKLEGRSVFVPVKSKITAGVLGILLGDVGAHKFYLGQPLLGALYLVFCWTFIPGLIGLIEGIIYLTMDDRFFANKYGGRTM